VVLVHLYNSPEENDSDAIKESLRVMGKIFPQLEIEFVAKQGKFGPEMIDSLSQEFGIPKNNIFIGAPEEKHNFSVADLGGVRIIF